MGRRLAGYVPIHDGDTTTWYGPDDIIPADVAEQIGDHAWIDDDGTVTEAAEPDTGSSVGDGPPPKSGKGSGTDAWADYAERQHVEVDADATRDEIITALQDAGKPTE